MPTLMFGYVGHDLLHSFSLGWFESAQWVEILYEIKVFCIRQCFFMALFIFIRGHSTTTNTTELKTSFLNQNS